MMKIGQMASYVDDGLSPAVRHTLARLQDSVPPMSPQLAAEAVEAELGAPPERAFARWDPRPIATASIGQVHRAVTLDGRAVAVKVQYPGIAETVAADLGNAALLRRMLRIAALAQDLDALLSELRDRIGEELDYRREAASQRLLGAYYDGHPTIHIPGVVSELSTRKLLTGELSSGVRFAELASWSQHERDLAAETIYRFVFRSLYDVRAFNGDRTRATTCSTAAAGSPSSTSGSSGDSVPLQTVKTSGPPLTIGGKPAIVFVSEESCPFCAAERWSLTVALSHFGTWSHLGTTTSSATDVYPDTATLSFRAAHYQSTELTLRTTELTDNAGRPLQAQTPLDTRLIDAFDVPPYVNSADQSGAVPFLDIANRYVLAGAQYDPQVLAGLSAAQIASQLSNPSSPVAQDIDGSAKVIIAAIDQVLHDETAGR
jgi:hypothetical protein